MKRIANQFTNPRALVISAVAFLVTIAFAGANLSYAVPGHRGHKSMGKVSKVDRTEARIKDLQARLKITPAQEDLWKKVTEVDAGQCQNNGRSQPVKVRKSKGHERYRRS